MLSQIPSVVIAENEHSLTGSNEIIIQMLNRDIKQFFEFADSLKRGYIVDVVVASVIPDFGVSIGIRAEKIRRLTCGIFKTISNIRDKIIILCDMDGEETFLKFNIFEKVKFGSTQECNLKLVGKPPRRVIVRQIIFTPYMTPTILEECSFGGELLDMAKVASDGDAK